MVWTRKRKARPTETSINILNGINRKSPRVARQRRQPPRGDDIYNIPPDTPPMRKKRNKPKEASSSPNESQEQQIDNSPQEGNEEDSGRESTPGVAEQSDHASGASEHDDNSDEISKSPENNNNDEDEASGDPTQGHAPHTSDGNEAQDESRQSSPPGAQRKLSSDLSSSGGSSSSESADNVKVVIHTHGEEQKEGSDEESAETESSSSFHKDAIPETPPAVREPLPGLSHALTTGVGDGPEVEAGEDIMEDYPFHDPVAEHELYDGPSGTSEVKESPQPTIQQTQPTTEQTSNSASNELYSWFFKEIEESVTEKSWRTLHGQGRALRLFRARPFPEYLEGLREVISELRKSYESIIESKEFSPALEEQFRNLRRSTEIDMRQIFEHASEKLQEASRLDQFEAHIISRMVLVVLLSFRTYKTIGRSAFRQFYETLDWVLRSSILVTDYKRGGLLPASARSRRLQLPLKRLKRALENQVMVPGVSAQPMPEAWPSQPSQPSQPLTQSTIPSSYVPWTNLEKEALLDGLQQFTTTTNDDRYVMIARHLGHRLPGRSYRDLKAKHQEFRRAALQNGKLGRYPWL